MIAEISAVRTAGRHFVFRDAKASVCRWWIQRQVTLSFGDNVSVTGVHLQISLCNRIEYFRSLRVLHKCANPACPNPFRKLSQGKLFLVDTQPPEDSEARRVRWKGQPTHRVEYYWLCDQCAFTFTLSYEKGRGVVAVPRTGVSKRMSPVAVRAAAPSVNGNRRSEHSA
jgi:hypothetical protein